MDYYTSWGDIPDKLATKTQLGKAGLKLSPGQKPAAKKTGGRGPFDLYDKNEAIPKRPSSSAQLAAAKRNIEKARSSLHCIDCDQRDRLDKNGRCPICHEIHFIHAKSHEASQRLVALSAADDWLIIDTETTGLEEDDEIIQIGIIDAAGQVVLDQLIKPKKSISQEATAVHGIKAEDVADSPTWAEVSPQVMELLNGRLALAYNAEFDRRMIYQSCRLHGLDLPTAVSWGCIMELFAAVMGDWSEYHGNFKYCTLTTVCYAMGLRPHDDTSHQPHTAMGDAWLTWRLLRAFGAKYEVDQL